VRAAHLALLDHGDRDFAELLGELRLVLEQLQQANRTREPRGAAADDRDADVDPLVLGVELALDEFLARVDGGREVGGPHSFVVGHRR